MSRLPMASSAVASVHIWGFFDDEGNPKRPNGAAPSDLSPYHHHRQVERNVTHFGGSITNLRTTRTLDDVLVATEFETPPRDGCLRMWHQIVRAEEPWPDPNDEPPIPTDTSPSDGARESTTERSV